MRFTLFVFKRTNTLEENIERKEVFIFSLYNLYPHVMNLPTSNQTELYPHINIFQKAKKKKCSMTWQDTKMQKWAKIEEKQTPLLNQLFSLCSHHHHHNHLVYIIRSVTCAAIQSKCSKLLKLAGKILGKIAMIQNLHPSVILPKYMQHHQRERHICKMLTLTVTGFG